MDEKKLWIFVKNNAKPSYKAILDDKNKPANVVANKGLEEGEIAVRGGAEYNGFGIRALEYIKPILTNLRISKAIKKLSEGNIQGAIKVLRIEKEVQTPAGSMYGGLELMYGVLKIWLENNNIKVPNEYIKRASIIRDQKLLKWINSMSWSPIQGEFEITESGFNKFGTSVVPESWIGKKYKNADDLHKEMDSLEWRKGKPAVNFCCIYAMAIKKKKRWEELNQISIDGNIKIGIEIFPVFDQKKNLRNLSNLNSKVLFFENKKQYKTWLDKLPRKSKLIIAGLQSDEPDQKLLLACDLEELVEKNPQYIKKRTVGIYVSRLQKLIRRGRKCANILKETLIDLWKSPGYNLPEQQFIRVSACRQLAWRIFITTIEDVEPYLEDKNDEYLSMLDLACLAILANIDTEITFKDNIFKKILYTALLIQHNDCYASHWNFSQASDHDISKVNVKMHKFNNFLTACKLLYSYMPMREGDNFMIMKSFNHVLSGNYELKPLEKKSINELLNFSDEKAALQGELAGYDMAPNPNILITLQSAFPFIPYDEEKHTTKGLSGFIWKNSSSINVRIKDQPRDHDVNSLNILKSLTNIQNYIRDENFYKLNIKEYINTLSKQKYEKYLSEDKEKIREIDSRLGFLLLFGQKIGIYVNKKRYEIIVTGTVEVPCKAKSISKNESLYLEGQERFDAELAYIGYLNNNKIIIDVPKPPIGYRWIWGHKNKIQIDAQLVKSDFENLTNEIIFIADQYELKPFDASSILMRLEKVKPVHIPKEFANLIEQIVYRGNKKYDDFEINLILKKLSKYRLKNFHFLTYNWQNIGKKSDMPTEIWRGVLLKFYNNFNGEAQIGPVDGKGNKLHDSIDYLYEGTILRIFTLLSFLYPNVIVQKASLKYQINSEFPEYLDLIKKLEYLAFEIHDQKKTLTKVKKIKLITKLWEHQEKTSQKILDEIITFKKYGFGDASNVGAGKTLTALSIMAGLYNHNMKNNDLNYSGFLILLPTTYLYKTWIDEIKKHTEGFEIILQNANGSLERSVDNYDQIQINPNSILITTLGRMRDHPLNQSWIFVVIDECLSVQNKNALQTGEAFKQIVASQYKVLLMSATFFRSRFDKLFYMLKMLNSGLPENKIYLDTILSERIISFQPAKTRNWKTKVHKFKLPTNLRKHYDLLLRQELGAERLYIKLASFLYDNYDYAEAFRKIIKQIDKRKRRSLIYGRSKEEADILGERIKGVTRFPDISGRHIAISYTEGTYGLNQLIFLDTIVTRPPVPDARPQMMGRLDRPGQKSDVLYMEYLVVENTIEEASLFRLELANNFIRNYLMPLAEFYELAVGKRKKEEYFNK